MKVRTDYPCMTVRELIEELKKIENQDGIVQIGIGFGSNYPTEFPSIRGSKMESGDYENYVVKMNPCDRGARIFVMIPDSWENKRPTLTYRKKK